ncbi:hypothetical protein TK78_00060 [Streptomyces sp. Tue 6075]|uniref:hypothetical protein n=1 Tax=Streptomyces sp. Tue 6075 TaxID=1661694 RepID=UPI00094A2C7C|nr:hypothetical protein [Streptomyces sp. Tue 6075]APS17509.1 hypothetical protein TK78_00060 [Streptomyces sp. Tue 6075]
MTNDFEAHLAATLGAATENIRQTMAASIRPAPKVELPTSLRETLAKAVAPLLPVLERLDAMMPGNWRGQHLDYERMVRLMQEGVPLAWVPPADVIRQLLAADDASSRSKVIDDSHPAILASCREALAEVTDARLTPQRTLLEECARAIENGMFNSAQALAANVWDTLMRGIAFANPDLLTSKGTWNYRHIRRNVPSVDAEEDATLGELRRAAVFLPVAKVLEDFWHPQPVPFGFNRHATAHAAGTVQYTASNAMTALMLAVSVLREIDDQAYVVHIHA